MSETNTNILLKLSLQFEGVSHILQSDGESSEQCLYLLTDSVRAQNSANTLPQLRARAKDPNKVREVLLSFLGAIKRGLRYRPDSASPNVADVFRRLLPQRESLSSIEFYQKMYHIMSELDETGFAGIDPLLTIRNGICYLEAFDKRAKRSLTLELDSSLWEDGFHFVDGTAHICMTPEFIESLTTISARLPLNIEIGTDVGDQSSTTSWKGELKKTFSVDLDWMRSAMLLQGVTGLNIHSVDMFRVDFFNTLRTLRMNKAKTHKTFKLTDEREVASMRFRLNPGDKPVLVLEPWGLEIECHAEPYSGPKAIDISMFGNRRDMLLLDRLLPYSDSATFTLFDSALHNCLEVSGDGFSCSMVLAGFGRGNWYRRLQMESMLPPFTVRPEGSAIFDTLDQTKTHTLDGSESLKDRKLLIGEILRGDALFLGARQTFVKRSLLGQSMDMERLFVMGFADTLAREHLANGRVKMEPAFHTSGELRFENATVTEALREGEDTPFVATPRFYLRPNGMLSKVGCSCTIWKEDGERGFGGPCSHLRALWLNYCQEIESLREAKDAGEDTGPALFEERVFTRKNEERIVGYDIRTKCEFTERWKGADMMDYRHSIQIYSNEEGLRRAFDKRCAMLTRRGYQQNS